MIVAKLRGMRISTVVHLHNDDREKSCVVMQMMPHSLVDEQKSPANKSRDTRWSLVSSCLFLSHFAAQKLLDFF